MPSPDMRPADQLPPACAAPEDPAFTAVLDRYFRDEPDPRTPALLE